MGPKEKLIQEILDKELRMFLAVVPQEPVSCQRDPEGFRVTRGAQFSVWSEQTLVSYREDLEKALIEDKNLMTLKYARMDNLIPKLRDDIMVEDLETSTPVGRRRERDRNHYLRELPAKRIRDLFARHPFPAVRRPNGRTKPG